MLIFDDVIRVVEGRIMGRYLGKGTWFGIVCAFMCFGMYAVTPAIWAANANVDDGDPARFTNSIGMEFVKIPVGIFTMGSPADEPERDSDERQHDVIISSEFHIQISEVTVGQWRVFAKDAGYKTDAEREGWSWIWNGKKWEKKEGCRWDAPGFEQSDHHPVTCVSWNDAEEFVKWLNRKEGLTAILNFRKNEHASIYRLPTEAEWEYACRAGTETPFYTGQCMRATDANYDGRFPMPGCPGGMYRQKTTRTGSFPCNAWGLFDMNGNVWEWCEDWKGNYPEGRTSDPKGPEHGKKKVMRGGGWHNKARYLRSADRSTGLPDVRAHYLGFRVAKGF